MLDNIAQAITGFLGRNNNPLGLLVLGITALVEYVFPPFPGDTITLFGAFLVTRYAWNMGLVFASVLVGSGTGAMADYYAGVWLGERYRAGRFLRQRALREKVDAVIAAFRRHGEAYVALNRFLPGLRAVFFLAAGMAGLRPLRVLLFALLSAAAWNAVILSAGYALGANWNRIRSAFATYSEFAWVALALAVVVFVGRWWWRRRHGDSPGSAGPQEPPV